MEHHTLSQMQADYIYLEKKVAIRALEVYVHGSEEILIQAARGGKTDGLETASVLKRS